MLTATLGAPGSPLSILCLGAHCDDIAIGCGGTLLRLLKEREGSSVHWVVFAGDQERQAEERACAAEILRAATRVTIDVHSFRDSFFPSVIGPIKERFEALKAQVEPDVVFTHRGEDRHQDHRVVADLTWNTFRDHLIAEYEIPKYDADLGQPGLFVPLTQELARRKVQILLAAFPSQARRAWFRSETFEALMRLRGIECNAPQGFAEAFGVRKIVI